MTQRTVALAVIPREMAVVERAAVRRFSGGLPLAVPVMQGLYLYVRCDKDGAVDEWVQPILQRAAGYVAPDGSLSIIGSDTLNIGMAA